MNEETKTIDKEFLDQMIARLKDQKKIHKKYVFRVCLKAHSITLLVTWHLNIISHLLDHYGCSKYHVGVAFLNRHRHPRK
jgi:PPP5 TPR repeat region